MDENNKDVELVIEPLVLNLLEGKPTELFSISYKRCASIVEDKMNTFSTVDKVLAQDLLNNFLTSVCNDNQIT